MRRLLIDRVAPAVNTSARKLGSGTARPYTSTSAMFIPIGNVAQVQCVTMRKPVTLAIGATVNKVLSSAGIKCNVLY